MSALGKVLEGARVMQLRHGVSMREALALAIASARRSSRSLDTPHSDTDAILRMPHAASLDALLPRNREPTIEEIREAWKHCVAQMWVPLDASNDPVAAGDAGDTSNP